VESALIIPVSLPARLERERRRHVPIAALGVPAHVTLLFPFIASPDLTELDRRRIAEILGRHRAFEYRLRRVRAWPTALYLEVVPETPFVRLVRALVSAYPAWVPYGGAFPYVPHVTVAELPSAEAPQIADPRRPLLRHADHATLIAQDEAGRWRTRWRFAVGGPGR
jgi:2'-5' RNA ligase